MLQTHISVPPGLCPSATQQPQQALPTSMQMPQSLAMPAMYEPQILQTQQLIQQQQMMMAHMMPQAPQVLASQFATVVRVLSFRAAVDPSQLKANPTQQAMCSLTAQEAASLGGMMSSGGDSQKQVHLRKAAGHIWSDPTLDDWPENDHRVFCGDLGNEVTDEVLAAAFRKFKSFSKARVVRDKRTGKTKGYGFVSFGDPQDMLKAIKEMNYKYVGNRPIRVLRSKWKEREIDSERNRQVAAVVAKVEKNDSKTLRKFKKLGVTINGGKAARNHEILASQAPRIRKNYVPPVAYGRMTYQYIRGGAPPSVPAPAPGTGASSHLLDDI